MCWFRGNQIEVALIGIWFDGPDRYERVDEEVVDGINQWIVSAADRWIVAAREDEATVSLRQWQALKNAGTTLGPLNLETFEIGDLESDGFGVGAFLR
jgi:hypothetical protein